MNKELLELFKSLSTGWIVGRPVNESDYCVRLSKEDIKYIIKALEEVKLINE